MSSTVSGYSLLQSFYCETYFLPLVTFPMRLPSVISSPDDAALDSLCSQLVQRCDDLDTDGVWPCEQLELCGQYGVFQWFLPVEHRGQAWSDQDVIRGYLRLSASCLTTTFVLTQLTGASRRIAACQNDELARDVLPDLVCGKRLATLGISHLTTSRRHLAKPVLEAREDGEQFVLDGFSPWVTGAGKADIVVTGATFQDGRQILVALPLDSPGVIIPPAAKLVALSASQTGQVRLNEVRVSRRWLIDGPREDIMQQGTGAKTGGLQTSTLAVGLATAAVDFLLEESEQRNDLVEPAGRLQADCQEAREDILALASGESICSTEQLRIRANSLVLRATQAALAAAKGTGYVQGHPAGRWCREALFFLVWSCPQPVMAANLCELAGISE